MHVDSLNLVLWFYFIIKIDASLLLFEILSVCSFQPHLLLQYQNRSVAVELEQTL